MFLSPSLSIVIEKLAKGHIKFTFLGKEFKTHWTGIVAGMLFIILGLVFILFRNTTIFTIKAAQLGYPLRWAYSLQEQMIGNPILANALAIIGIVVLALLIYFTYKSYKRKRS